VPSKSSNDCVNSLVTVSANKTSKYSLLMPHSTITQSSKGKQKKVIPKNPQSLTLNFNPLTFLMMQKLFSSGNPDLNVFVNPENRNDENEN
jgi:hypothetical protein